MKLLSHHSFGNNTGIMSNHFAESDCSNSQVDNKTYRVKLRKINDEINQSHSDENNQIHNDGIERELPFLGNKFIQSQQICQITNKVIHYSEKAAKKTMRKIQTQPGANFKRLPTYVYQCEFCNKWHLTSCEFGWRAG